MKRSLTIAFVITGGIVLSALIFGIGFLAGRTNLGTAGYGPYNTTMMSAARAGAGVNDNTMMAGYRSVSSSNVKPLTVDQVKQAVEKYMAPLNNADLELKEIMIFDNNAYARITEKSTGIGAMELLVDPTSLSVFPEYGPNMMWNLKYGRMAGYGSGLTSTPCAGTGVFNGMMGRPLTSAPNAGASGYNGMMSGLNGMMGRSQVSAPNAGVCSNFSNSAGVSAAMSVTSDEAVKIAQQYLDQQFPGEKADTAPDPFYGYYTIDILKDGKPTGMLSVNGSSGQVFLHTWHGNFIEVYE